MAAVSPSDAVRVPGDKSISHRALMFAALGSGDSVLRGLLPSADVRSTAGVLRSLGVEVPDGDWTGAVRVRGVGLHGLRAPQGLLDCGNSGTTARLMSGILAGQAFPSTLTGDASLSRRPMRRVARPLSQMGAHFAFERDDGLPMTIRGGALHSLDWVSPTASAQVKSAILLAGVAGGVPVRVSEPARSRDHTERMLRALGVDVLEAGDTVALTPADALAPLDLEIPGDPSSAIFLLAWAALHGTTLRLAHVGQNPTRTGGFAVLARMGVPLERLPVDVAGEPVGPVAVTGPARLQATAIGGDEIPALIDEIPMLACVAARAEGETRITDAAELRVKESDRIRVVVENLRAIGVRADETADGLTVVGSTAPLRGSVTTHGDHRIAMAFGVLASLPDSAIRIDDPGCVDVSFPGFWARLAELAAAR